jgi:hypothetical protein
MFAVFEPLDLSTLETILRGATEESSLEFVRVSLVKPQGPGTVPDGRISGSFNFLFEVKTAYDALKRKQLSGHLAHLDDPHYSDQRLFVVTPDPQEPPAIGAVSDERVRWLNFRDLSNAIDGALRSEDVPGDERILLRELKSLFAAEGLLGREDVVVVAARRAYGFYLDWSAYVCQAGRPFRPGIERMGFYRRRRIETEFPTIIHRRDDVIFSRPEAERLRVAGGPFDEEVARVIEGMVGAGLQIDGQPYQVFLLSPSGDPRTLILDAPIEHVGIGAGSAWTMGQRYVNSERLKENPRTTGDLTGGAELAAGMPDEV